MDDAHARALAEFLCSRLCHDLAGALGPLANGVELIDEQGGAADAETLALLKQSSAFAVDRLRFFRLAFGAAGSGLPNVGYEEALAYVRALLPQRTALAWQVTGPTPRPGPGAIKLMLNAVLLAAETLPRGGTLRVAIDADRRLTVDAEPASGGTAVLGEAARAALDGKVDAGALTVKTAPPALLGMLARAAGAGLTVRQEAAALRLALTLPAL